MPQLVKYDVDVISSHTEIPLFGLYFAQEVWNYALQQNQNWALVSLFCMSKCNFLVIFYIILLTIESWLIEDYLAL